MVAVVAVVADGVGVEGVVVPSDIKHQNISNTVIFLSIQVVKKHWLFLICATGHEGKMACYREKYFERIQLICTKANLRVLPNQ